MKKYKVTFTKREKQESCSESYEYIVEDANINTAVATASEKFMKKMRISNTNDYDISCVKLVSGV